MNLLLHTEIAVLVFLLLEEGLHSAPLECSLHTLLVVEIGANQLNISGSDNSNEKATAIRVPARRVIAAPSQPKFGCRSATRMAPR